MVRHYLQNVLARRVLDQLDSKLANLYSQLSADLFMAN